MSSDHALVKSRLNSASVKTEADTKWGGEEEEGNEGTNDRLAQIAWHKLETIPAHVSTRVI